MRLAQTILWAAIAAAALVEAIAALAKPAPHPALTAAIFFAIAAIAARVTVHVYKEEE